MEIIETSTTVRPAANLTPDEKRGLLFDITCPLEISMEDFDENWWPLVSNIWTQWNSYKQANVENEAVKNYSPPAITVAVREYATELGLGTSVSKLKRKEVSNIKYKVCGPMESHLFCNSDSKSDISESISFLIEKIYTGNLDKSDQLVPVKISDISRHLIY
ncbi:hypothetical protein RhiirC2_853965 [Rhizophagus irregularis]|uniref:Uncharacterized protein n=1 Tax=Rhizophagus irregularis TaxID=588596 RepID=A0A2N1MTE7_9GLOM|nr:hypothetical protein RhiirC2_853965 [Rhizophagus irregularis]